VGANSRGLGRRAAIRQSRSGQRRCRAPCSSPGTPPVTGAADILIRLSNSERVCVRILAARRARALRRFPPSSEKRAQGRPGARCTRGLVCKMHIEKRTRAYRFSGGNPAFPAQWFTAYSALSPVTGLSCHRHPREVFLPANLTPASGRQDHTASPSARVTLVSRNSRVHRIPPRVRDDRDTPLSSGETGGAIVMIWPTG
jgi:hypothetical protein